MGTQAVKHLVESTAVVAAANGIVWTVKDFSAWVQVTLGIVSSIWIAMQASKFLIYWLREEIERRDRAKLKRKKPPTDFGNLEGSGD